MLSDVRDVVQRSDRADGAVLVVKVHVSVAAVHARDLPPRSVELQSDHDQREVDESTVCPVEPEVQPHRVRVVEALVPAPFDAVSSIGQAETAPFLIRGGTFRGETRAAHVSPWLLTSTNHARKLDPIAPDPQGIRMQHLTSRTNHQR
ncbi:hypothetical protein KZI27_16015 [Curtobacterium sp. TC1]|uniref:hypothetical protein n=1 Tax=Curtobacterium sp. TC1 TaxID=2862880 RepID=UPI001C9B5575|nr:hypothetical protein [Curtobacterium sp. TC1]QZQ54774.1 hypothetical protein KZI27_16015 [Curtobacterium sp. TC1]